MAPGFGDREAACAARLIELALEEDGAARDRTTAVAVDPARTGRAHLRSRQIGVVAGLPLVGLTLAQVDPSVRVELAAADGDGCQRGDTLAHLVGRVGSILTAERTFLNFVGSLSGIATATRAMVDAVGEPCRVLDTRKTWPGARALQKYAVRCGGGHNHRFGLDDAILFKDNHLAAASSWSGLIERARREHPGIPIEVEVDTLEQLGTVLELDVDRIMLDNFGPDRVRQAVQMRTERGAKVPFEVSGGVTLKIAPALAAAGADFVSVGALTHSAPALDVGLDLEP